MTNILQQLKAAQAKQKNVTIATLDLCFVGETFEFVKHGEPLAVGDTVNISLQYQPPYGKAKITKVIDAGYYEAERSE